ncbi:MAG: hypothetical protein TEF_21935 [Rhizobiales bacterium NRL2]|jgi:hypothetical protein|nr:MAG: hypothetical protein TEF_21935 [Rhizobiales bacterium NRL2]
MTDQHDRSPAPQAGQDTSPEPQRPAETLRDGSIKASIWRNEGEKGPFYTTSLSRTYTDAEGNSRDTSSFIGTDLLKVAELARGAYERTREMRREDFSQKRETGKQKNRTSDRSR